MSEPHAVDMSRYQRIIHISDGRVQGDFRVMPNTRNDTIWVDPIEVTVWDDINNSGIVIYTNDVRSIPVKDGHADVRASLVHGRKDADIEDALAEFETAVVLAAAAFPVSGESRMEP
jgi:hypothetical protein